METKRNPLVLVVEDHAPTRGMIARTLESAGFRACSAGNAVEGLSLAEREHPDLILMDLVLPGINGDIAAAAMRNDSSLGTIPVVLVSSVPDLDSRRPRSGAVEVLPKPFKPVDLVRCANRWTRTRQMEQAV